MYVTLTPGPGIPFFTPSDKVTDKLILQQYGAADPGRVYFLF
jgi:hypothetical protein